VLRPEITTDELAIADAIDRMLLWARRKAPTHLSATSITTLDTLSNDGPLRISELATREGVSQPGMTTLINRLTDERLAERFADPTDGRAILVRITPAGTQVLRERHASRTKAIQADISQLSPTHRANLADALAALNALCSTDKGTSADEGSAS
jgi:DNA-binding MarR family transcriptional regulator